MGAAAFYIYVQHIHNVTLLEWLTVPMTFLFTNLFEWAVHRYVMHRPVNIKGLRAIYERHTLNHHQFFTDQEMRFRDHKDWRVTVFPPYALVVFILMSIPAGDRPRHAALAQRRLAVHVRDHGHVSRLRVHALLLPCRRELVRAQLPVRQHACAATTPPITTRELMMEVNMNLTFPIADWLFGTSDLERGLLGHLFNGYDTSYLKGNLRGRAEAPGRGGGRADGQLLVGAPLVDAPGRRSNRAATRAAPTSRSWNR